MVPSRENTKLQQSTLESDKSELTMARMVLTQFFSKVTYDNDSEEFRYTPTGQNVRLWDDRNIIYHEASRKCYQFQNATSSLMTVEVEHCPMGTGFLLCKDKVLRPNQNGQMATRQRLVTHSLIQANRKSLVMMLLTRMTDQSRHVWLPQIYRSGAAANGLP